LRRASGGATRVFRHRLIRHYYELGSGLPRLLQTADVEILRSGFIDESIVCGIVHLGRSRQNPKVFPGWVAHQRICVIRRERDDLIPMKLFRSFSSIVVGLPRNSGGSAPAFHAYMPPGGGMGGMAGKRQRLSVPRSIRKPGEETCGLFHKLITRTQRPEKSPGL
jgi:hypothetical protein